MPTLDFGIGKHPLIATVNARMAHGQYTGPASYVTGGDPWVAGDVKLSHLTEIFFGLAVNGAGTIRGLLYDSTNDTVLWFVLDTGNEVANGTDLSGFNSRFLAVEG